MGEHKPGVEPVNESADSRSPFRLGDVVDDRYLIDGYIARGGMSVVYRALDIRLDRPVALKVLRPDLVSKEEFRERFVAEAKTVANLQGQGIVGVMDQGMWQGNAFLAMELVAGGTVRELLAERGPMPPYAAVAVLLPTLEALAVAHKSDFVHQDVKPENILIGNDGTIKVADFGLVQAANRATSDKNIIGTLAYLSPEQLNRKNVDQRTDVYAAGLVLYELLVGTPPFGMPDSKDAAKQRLSMSVPNASRQRPGIPADFDALIHKATNHNPAQRFSDAEEMAAALRALSQKLQLPRYTVPAPKNSAEQIAAATALSTTGTTEVISDEQATEVIRAKTAILTSPVTEETPFRFPDDDAQEPTEIVPLPAPEDSPSTARFLVEKKEPSLSPEEQYAQQLASHPRAWPVLVWLLLLGIILAGLATGMYHVGEAIVQPAIEPNALVSDAAFLRPGMTSQVIVGC
ncbi:MAG: serine/threonine-protein kinase [Lawsonella sp.]